MGHIAYLQKAIDYIEEHIRQEVAIDDCARAAGFSKYYFYRLFGLYMNTTVMEYVRKRKLAYALQDVSEGRRILDIAVDYGYGSERAFSRAFVSEYMRSPRSYRGIRYVIPAKPDLEEIMKKSGGNLMDNPYSEIRFETLKDMVVASASVISHTPEDDVMTFMTKWADKKGIQPGARKFGFDVPVSDSELRNGLRGYEYWICVEPGTAPEEGIAIKGIKSGKYAVLSIRDPFSDPFGLIPRGWKMLAEWVSNQGLFKPYVNERYWLEEVLERDGVTCMDLYFPVE